MLLNAPFQEHSYLPTVAAARDLYFYPALKEFMASSQHMREAESGKRPRVVAMMTHGNQVVVTGKENTLVGSREALELL